MANKSGEANAEKLRKLANLFGAAKELHDKQAALLAEIDAVLSGGATIGQKLKVVTETWMSNWRERYRTDYHFSGKDGKLLKNLLASLTVDELNTRIVNYIRNGDQFYVSRRHSLEFFSTQSNRFASVDEEASFELDNALPPGTRAVGCVHVPACRSDAEHTARRNRELRILEQ